MRQPKRALGTARGGGTGEEIAYLVMKKKLTGNFQRGGAKGEKENLFGTRSARDGNV